MKDSSQSLRPSGRAVPVIGPKTAERWYYGDAECRMGPFSAQELREFVACGLLLPTDTVWKEGIENGVQARTVKNLFPPGHADTPRSER